MWTGFSAAATAALVAASTKLARKVEVWDAGGRVADITYAVTAGQVVEDETAPARRTCTLTLNDPALLPEADTDLLHPLSGNELRVYRGVTLASGTEWAPLGVFRLTTPLVTDTGTDLQMQITGQDRSSEIARRSWTGPYTAAAGQTVGAAIKAIINSRWTGTPLQFNLYPSTVVVPTGTVLGVQFTSYGAAAASGSTSGGNNPWQDCINLALSAGCELLFDRQGVVVMRPVPEPGQTASAASFAEGVTCRMVQAQRTLDATTFYNGVILIGTGTTVTNPDGSVSPGNPVVATAWSTDPQVGPDGPLGARPDIITDQTVSTQAEAQAAANAQLPLVLAALEQPAFQAPDDPRLDAGDQVDLARARMRLTGSYIQSAITHPLDATTLMQVTCRSFAVAA